MKVLLLLFYVFWSSLGSQISEIDVKTSSISNSGCDFCSIYLTICDISRINCCDTGELNNSGDDFETGHTDSYTGTYIGQCNKFELNTAHPIIAEVQHTGWGGWRGEYVRIIF